MYSPDLPDFPPPDCAGCQIGGIEVAGAIRAGLRGELPVRRLSDAGIADCTSGDAFEFQVGDYVVVGFVDDPGAVDYIAEVRHGDRVAGYWSWRVQPEDHLTDDEQERFSDLVGRL